MDTFSVECSATGERSGKPGNVSSARGIPADSTAAATVGATTDRFAGLITGSGDAEAGDAGAADAVASDVAGEDVEAADAGVADAGVADVKVDEAGTDNLGAGGAEGWALPGGSSRVSTRTDGSTVTAEGRERPRLR